MGHAAWLPVELRAAQPRRPFMVHMAHCQPAAGRALACSCRCCLMLLSQYSCSRRKKKAVHKTTSTDDKRLQSTLKRLGVNTIPGIEEVRLGLVKGKINTTFPPRVNSEGPVSPIHATHAAMPLRNARTGHSGPAVAGTRRSCRSTAAGWCQHDERWSAPDIAPSDQPPHSPPFSVLPPPQVLLINADGSALQFNNPKVQASIAANTYVVSGASQPKRECPCSAKFA